MGRVLFETLLWFFWVGKSKVAPKGRKRKERFADGEGGNVIDGPKKKKTEMHGKAGY